MTFRRARRLGSLVQSDIRRMTRECERVGGINLGQGICDLPTPPLVRDGAIEAIRARKSTYSFAEGALELRTAIARKLAERNGITADPATEIVVTVGATGAFACAIHALLDPGDGLLVMEPYYGYHLNCALLAGLEPHFLPLAAPEFRLEEAALRAALRPNTRAIVLCTPNNPCGRMFGRAELDVLAKVAREKDLWVITDEIYEDIRYDGREHVSPATIPGLADRTITILGLSKTFSITGWRLGYAVAAPEVADLMNRVRQPFNVNALAQAAAIAALGDDRYVAESHALNRQGMQALEAGLRALGLEWLPSHANFLLVKVGDAGRAYHRLLQQGVIVRPVANYGLPEWLRVTIGLPEENRRFLAALATALAR